MDSQKRGALLISHRSSRRKQGSIYSGVYSPCVNRFGNQKLRDCISNHQGSELGFPVALAFFWQGCVWGFCHSSMVHGKNGQNVSQNPPQGQEFAMTILACQQILAQFLDLVSWKKGHIKINHIPGLLLVHTVWTMLGHALQRTDLLLFIF